MLFLDIGKGRPYEKEIEDILGRTAAESPVLEEASWFLELAGRRLRDFSSGREYDIPVIRMETDYNNQDVEQLRLRVEAFAEILRQRDKKQRRSYGDAES